MALVLADRVKETTTTTGTGTYTLAGAADSSFETFASIGNGNTTYYACTDGSDFEVGIGTYTASGTTLARTTILQSSNSDNAVNWGAGTKDIFCTQPAEKAVFLDASGHIIALDGRNLTNVDAATLDSIDSGSFLRSDAADTKTSGNLTFSDDVQIVLGGSNDFVMKHTAGGNTIFQENNTSGGLLLKAANLQIQNPAGDEVMADFNVNGAVELYHDNALRFTTTSTGAKVTGGTGDGTLIIESDTDNSGESDNALLQLTQDGGLSVGEFGFDSSNALFIKNTLTGAVGNVQFMNGTEILAKGIGGGAFELYHDNSKKLETTSSGATVTGQLVATSLDISGDVDVDGTLEADAMTLNGTAITSTATLSTGISNNNVPKFTSGVADNDFLRVDGTAIEGRSASQVLSDIGGISASSTDTLTNKTLTTPVINGFSGTGNGTITGDLTLTSTDAGSGEDPNLKLFRNSSSPANSDNIGTVQFQGKNNADETTTFAEIQSQISDVSDGAEDGVLYFQVRRNGSLTSIANVSGGSGRFNISNGDLFLQTGAELIFEGATADAHETTLTITDPTADRTITLPNATGQVVLADGAIDTDASAEIGRAHVGHMGFSDLAGFSHVDQNSTTGYALLQQSSGNVFLNAPSGQTVNFLINNSNVAYINTTGLNLNTGYNLRFEGATADDHETILTVTDPTADRTITLPNATGTVSLLTNTETLTNKTLTTPVINGFSGTGDASITGTTTTTSLRLTGTTDVTTSSTGHPLQIGPDNNLNIAIDGNEIQARNNGSASTLYLNISGGSVNVGPDLALTDTDSGSGEGPTLDFHRNSSSPADGDVLGSISFSGEDSGGNKTAYAKINADAIDVTDGTEDGRLDFKIISNGSESQRMTLAGSQTIFQNADVKISDADLLLESTDAGATENPTLDLYRNSASPADNDVLGHIHFSGENDADQKVAYGEIEMRALDVSDGTEDGRLVINSILNGTTVTHYATGFGFNQFFKDVLFAQNINMQFEGATNDGVRTTVTVADPSSNRTITLPDATGTVLLADGDGSSLTNVNATTLDSVDSTSFLRSDAADTKTSGNLQFSDNVRLRLGSSGSSDLQIWHDGTNSNIVNGTGDLIIGDSTGDVKIQGKYGEQSIIANNDGSVELYHDNSKKLETASGGISVTGEIAATSLDISGDVDVDGTLEADAITLNGTSLAASATTDTTNASNIGSGTLPNARLDAQLQDVAGLAVTNGNFIVGDGSNFVAESGSTARDSLSLGTSSDVQFDSFGVGTAASGTTGEIRATADITSNYSDERLKNIHGTIPNALDKVKSLGGYYFTENEIAKSLGYDNDAQQVGVIAQEVEKVLPEAVKPAPIDDKYLTVQYEKMVPLLIEAMKEQQAKIEELESRLAKLEA